MNDTSSREDTGIDDVSPVMDLECPSSILLLDSIANVNELAVFEDEEVMLLREFCESLNGLRSKVGYNIDMGLEDCNIRAETYFRDIVRF